MKFTFLIPILILIFANSSQAAHQCKDLFSPFNLEQALKSLQPTELNELQSAKVIKATEPSKKSTTSARAEIKFALVLENMQRILGNFKSRIEDQIKGFTLVDRVVPIGGKRNMTWTGYSNRFTLNYLGKKLRAKIRVRKYGTIEADAEITKENLQVLENMKDKSYFEFKIEDPDHDQSVLKPRVLMFDSDANLLLNPNLRISELKEIELRTQKLNSPEKPGDIEAKEEIDQTIHYMLQAIQGLHEQGSLFQPEFETLYERVSYKVPLKNTTTGEEYDVQITLDADVIATSLLYNISAQSFKHEVEKILVTEVKIPIPLLQYLKTKDYKEVPGLEAVAYLLQAIDYNSLKNFQGNSGKLFHLIRYVI
jgi:hypothetical protein